VGGQNQTGRKEMNKMAQLLVVIVLMLTVAGCNSGSIEKPSPEPGLVPIHLTKHNETHANVSIQSDSDVIELKIPIAFKGGAGWKQIKTTHYVAPVVVDLMKSGLIKLVVSQKKNADGGIENTFTWDRSSPSK
jgi:hypothetical protein